MIGLSESKLPAGWMVKRLDFVARVKARLGWKGLTASEYVDEGYVFLSTPNIKGREIDFDKVNYITPERYFESPEIMLEPGDVLVTKDGSTLGTCSVVRNLPRPATVNGSIAVIRPKKKLDPVFLYYLFSSPEMQARIRQFKDGMGVPHLFQSDLRKFPIVVPPFTEQRAIADFLDLQTLKIEHLVIPTIERDGPRNNTNSLSDRLADLLREYRTALISAAVTGQIDVRTYRPQEAAAVCR